MKIGSRRAPLSGFVAIALTLGLPAGARAQAQIQAPETRPGQRFLIEEPITSESVAQIRAAAKLLISRNAADDGRPVLVFEFRPGKANPGGSGFGSSYELAHLIASELGGAHKTVSFIPEPLKGYAVLPALACDEIVMGERASVGPITPDGSGVNAGFKGVVRDLAITKGQSPALFLGLLDRDADLRQIRSGDKQIHYRMADELDEFAKTHQVLENRPAWDGTQRGVLLARRARDEGFAKLLADDATQVFAAYGISPGGLGNDPSLLAEPKAVWIKIEGPINAIKERFIAQRIQKARMDNVNLIFFGIDSEGGIDLAADKIAKLLSELTDIKTVAYVGERAIGVAALIPLACDDIVFRKGAKIGDVTKILSGGGSTPLTEGQVSSLSGRAAGLASTKGHSPALAAAMVDPATVVVSAKDSKTGAVGFLLRSQVDAEPGRYLDVAVVKEAGSVITFSAEEAVAHGLGRLVSGPDDLKGLYRIKGNVPEVGPTWVDGLVQTLNEPFVSSLLLFVGIFMLILEIKMPGVGLPAITAVVAFLLFFWSRFLSGTADQLEILLFVVGLICLGLELFVFPGFGVFGISGVLLLLISIVMASHTFVWPTQEYEYKQMLSTLMQVTGVLVSVGGGVAVVGRFLPSIPLFNKLILRPEPWDAREVDDPMAKPSADAEVASYSFLLGERGRTTTVLRPTGKARFGEMLIDVSADGFYVGAGIPVEVVEVQGQRVVVRSVQG